MNASDMPAATEFWAWSLAVYGRPGGAETCLRLQDEAGLDVNLVLLLLYLAATGRRPLGAAEVAALDRAVAPFRLYALGPARAARRALKAQGGPPYAAAKAAELDLEREAQRQLVAALPALAPDARPAEELAGLNLAAYGVTEDYRSIAKKILPVP
ncbi:TIGR02444 family protein [Zavarzinia sp.]|uniref:TIGR02444 family protein n=1 Tax=Zavarzinia sp. TaxID=2027920 RepID=UPI003566CE16